MDKITEIRERYKLETGILPHKDALNYADYLEEYIVKNCNAPAVSECKICKPDGYCSMFNSGETKCFDILYSKCKFYKR